MKDNLKLDVFCESFSFAPQDLTYANNPIYIGIDTTFENMVSFNLFQYLGATFNPIDVIFPLNVSQTFGSGKSGYFSIQEWLSFLYKLINHRQRVGNEGKYKWNISINLSEAFTNQKMFTCVPSGMNFSVAEFPLNKNTNDTAINLFNVDFEIILPVPGSLAFGPIHSSQTLSFNVICEYLGK